MIIHLIRHTTPQIAKATCYGQADIPLVESFEQERDVVHGKLRDNYDALFTSPLQRCALLAASISAGEQTIDERILEYNFGDWELKPWDEIRRADSKEWINDFVNVAAPGGESMLTMQARVMNFFEHLIELEHDHVAVVTHSGVQRIIHAHILKTPLKNMFNLQLDFGAVIEIKHDKKTESLTVRHL